MARATGAALQVDGRLQPRLLLGAGRRLPHRSPLICRSPRDLQHHPRVPPPGHGSPVHVRAPPPKQGPRRRLRLLLLVLVSHLHHLSGAVDAGPECLQLPGSRRGGQLTSASHVRATATPWSTSGQSSLFLCIQSVPRMARCKMSHARLRAVLLKYGHQCGEAWPKRALDLPFTFERAVAETLERGELLALLRHAWMDTDDAEEPAPLLTPAVDDMGASCIRDEADEAAEEADEEDSGEDKYEGMSEAELRDAVAELAQRLSSQRVVAVSTQVWDAESEKAMEAVAMQRAGVLFSMWFDSECFEMMRKLLMSPILVFVCDGTPAQLAVGFVISFATLIITFTWTPFVSSRLNRLHLYGLACQCITLYSPLPLRLSSEPNSPTPPPPQSLHQSLPNPWRRCR